MASIFQTLAIFMLILTLSPAFASPSCKTVTSQFKHCATFIEDHHLKNPSSSCCDGLKSIASEAKTKKDKVAICKCLKGELSQLELEHKVHRLRIRRLPKKCGVTVKIPSLHKNYDCSKLAN